MFLSHLVFWTVSLIVILSQQYANGRGAVKREEVNDAIKYLASLDRVYSEHARSRFGKRSAEEFQPEDQSEQISAPSEKRSGLVESILFRELPMKHYTKYLDKTSVQKLPWH